MSKKLTKEEALHFITTWRDSLDEPRIEDGYWHDVSDDLHNYFEATGARDRHDVSVEATKVYNIMFVNEHDDESCIVEDESPIASLWNAAAAQAAHGVWQSVADAFGLNVDVLESVLEDWYLLWGEDKTPPPPITMGEFMKRYKAEYKIWEKGNLL
jgi:hypothetical protein